MRTGALRRPAMKGSSPPRQELIDALLVGLRKYSSDGLQQMQLRPIPTWIFRRVKNCTSFLPRWQLCTTLGCRPEWFMWHALNVEVSLTRSLASRVHSLSMPMQ